MKATHCIYLKLIFQSLMMTFDITPAGGLWQLWLGGLAWTGGRWWWWGQPDQPQPTKLQSLSGRPRGGRAGGWGWAKDWNWSSGDLHFCFTYYGGLFSRVFKCHHNLWSSECESEWTGLIERYHLWKTKQPRTDLPVARMTHILQLNYENYNSNPSHVLHSYPSYTPQSKGSPNEIANEGIAQIAIAPPPQWANLGL